MYHGILRTIYSGANIATPGANRLRSDIEILFTAPLSINSNQPAFVQDSINLKRRASSQNVQRWEITTGLAPANDSFLDWDTTLNRNVFGGSAAQAVHNVLYGHNKPFYISMPQPPNASRLVGETLTQTTISGALKSTTSVTTETFLGDVKGFKNPYKRVVTRTRNDSTKVVSKAEVITEVTMRTGGSMLRGATSFIATNGDGAGGVAEGSFMIPGEFFNFEGYSKTYMVTNIVGDTVYFLPALLSAIPTAVNLWRGKNTIMKCYYDTDTQLGITYTDGIMSDPGTVKLIEAI